VVAKKKVVEKKIQMWRSSEEHQASHGRYNALFSFIRFSAVVLLSILLLDVLGAVI